MKVAVLGSGGREAAIAWKLKDEGSVKEEDLVSLSCGAVDTADFEALRRFCISEGVQLLIVGPEDPLVKGVVDAFEGSDIQVFGPHKRAAVLEGSKIWAKDFMKRHSVATADFCSFTSLEEAQDFVRKGDGRVVVKYDGLAAGKGVTVCSTPSQACTALEGLWDKYGKGCRVLIEERLEGLELSLVGVTDGKTVQLLSPSQDHKRAFENDEGPNTGGMGAYCPLPFWSKDLEEQIQERIIQPTLKGLQKEDLEFSGVLYFGVILSEEGPKLLEYNVRFGDPEAEVILPALRSSLLSLILSSFDGSLSEQTLTFHPGVFLDVVLASEGYPENPQIGRKIQGLDQLDAKALVFHAGVERDGGELFTKGGRVLNVVGHGRDFEEASSFVYGECKKISFEGMHYRKDIGAKAYSMQPLT